jgi:hypothetical protein
MFIARWQFTARAGKTGDCVAILRKWELDVGHRIGWRAGSVRLNSGYIGVAQEYVEFEGRVDSLSDLESLWRDMDKNDLHKEYLRQLDAIIVSSQWKVLRAVDD